MKPLKINIEKLSIKNKKYRKILYTTKFQQLVLMSIPSKDEIEKEKHAKSTQFIRIESGNAIAEIWENGNRESPKRYRLYDGISITIPPNTYHRIKNIGDDELKLYTIYSPPVH